MTQEHWFDVTSKAALQAFTRREVARSIAVVLPSLLFGGLAETAVARNKGGTGGGNSKGNKGKSHGKGPGKKPKKSKPKKPKPPPAPCSGGSCNREFVLQDNRDYCEFICRQCDGDDDPRHFCIVKAEPANPSNPMKTAVCCDEGATCCGDRCCPEGNACCDGHRCCFAGETCCDGACCDTDDPYIACCDGQCWNTEHAQEHCGACGNPCAAGEFCLLGQCVSGDDDECQNCPHGQFCWDGFNCGCGDGFKYCALGEACIREEYVCCGDTESIIRYCFAGLHCCGSGVNVTCGHTPCA